MLLVVAALLFALEAWLIMVVWGALALTFGFVTIGYGTAALVSLALGIVGGSLRSVRSQK